MQHNLAKNLTSKANNLGIIRGIVLMYFWHQHKSQINLLTLTYISSRCRIFFFCPVLSLVCYVGVNNVLIKAKRVQLFITVMLEVVFLPADSCQCLLLTIGQIVVETFDKNNSSRLYCSPLPCLTHINPGVLTNYFTLALLQKLLWALDGNFQVHSNSSHFNNDLQPIWESPATELEYQYSLKSTFPS